MSSVRHLLKRANYAFLDDFHPKLIIYRLQLCKKGTSSDWSFYDVSI